jgi:lysophospholipase L1-like esterase
LRVKTVRCQSRAFREAARQEVNAWIRTSHQFDAVLDFDRAVRDPANARQINPACDVGDHLHMNPAGYRRIAASLFRTLEAHVCRW